MQRSKRYVLTGPEQLVFVALAIGAGVSGLTKLNRGEDFGVVLVCLAITTLLTVIRSLRRSPPTAEADLANDDNASPKVTGPASEVWRWALGSGCVTIVATVFAARRIAGGTESDLLLGGLWAAIGLPVGYLAWRQVQLAVTAIRYRDCLKADPAQFVFAVRENGGSGLARPGSLLLVGTAQSTLVGARLLRAMPVTPVPNEALVPIRGDPPRLRLKSSGASRELTGFRSDGYRQLVAFLCQRDEGRGQPEEHADRVDVSGTPSLGEWRLRMHLEDDRGLGQRVRAADVDDQLREGLGEGFTVTREGSEMFVYGTGQSGAVEARDLAEWVIADKGLNAHVALSRWDDANGEWRRVDLA